MPSLDLYLHDRRVGAVEPAQRDRTRVTLAVDRDYQQGILLSESFAAIPGRRPPSDEASNFLGGYVPEGNHRERMAAKRHIGKDDLFGLLDEFGGSIAGAATLRRPDDPATTGPPTSRSTTGHSPRSSGRRSRTATALADAITAPPKGVSPGMVEHLQWNVQRLTAGPEISERKR